jgi:hypothetical protein
VGNYAHDDAAHHGAGLAPLADVVRVLVQGALPDLEDAVLAVAIELARLHVLRQQVLSDLVLTRLRVFPTACCEEVAPMRLTACHRPKPTVPYCLEPLLTAYKRSLTASPSALD